MEMRTEPSGVEVVTQGDTDSPDMFVIERGQVAVFITDKEGQTRRVNEQGPGTRFGDLAFMYYCARSSTVKVEQAATMWVLQRKVFNRLNVLHAEQVQRRKEELVANVPIFKMLDAAHRQTIVEALIPVTFQPGTAIIKKGEVGDTFYIVDKGQVTVSVEDHQLAKLGPNCSFGESALIKNEVRAGYPGSTSPSSSHPRLWQRRSVCPWSGRALDGSWCVCCGADGVVCLCAGAGGRRDLRGGDARTEARSRDDVVSVRPAGGGAALLPAPEGAGVG
eukprot:9502445-Pyramimonas_sp.AAC.1